MEFPKWGMGRGGHKTLGHPYSLFQFCIYSVYFMVLSVICFVGAVLDGVRYCRRGRHQPLPLPQELSPLENSVQVPSMQDGGLGGLQPSAPQLLPEDGVEDSEASLRAEAKA